MDFKFSDWIALFALLISILSIFNSWISKRRSERKINSMQREVVIQIMNDAKYCLQNPPSNGFDHTSNIPFFRIDQLDVCLSNKNAFSKHELELFTDARNAIYQAKSLIDEVNNLDSTLKQNVKFRQRFPKIKEDCINKLEKCLTSG